MVNGISGLFPHLFIHSFIYSSFHTTCIELMTETGMNSLTLCRTGLCIWNLMLHSPPPWESFLSLNLSPRAAKDVILENVLKPAQLLPSSEWILTQTPDPLTLGRSLGTNTEKVVLESCTAHTK